MLLLNDQVVKFGKFPNGEVNLPIQKELERNRVILKYEDDADLFRLLLLWTSLRNPSDLHITYFPYSRMDRASEDYAFTLHTVAGYINSMGWDSITIYEPHSDVTPALLDGCNITYVIPKLMSWWFIQISSSLPRSSPASRLDYQVFYPDAGAQKRYSNLLDTPELVGFKKRDFKTGRIKELQVIGEQKDDTVVIVDDLCSKGGTFILAAEKLREMGFKKIYLVVAHCEKTIFEGKVFSSGLIDGVYTTDSILDDNRGIENLHIMPLIPKQVFTWEDHRTV